MRRIITLLLLLSLVLSSLFAGPFRTTGGGVALSPLTDGLLVGGGATLIGTEALLRKFAPKERVYGGGPSDRSLVNSFDAWAMRAYSKSLDVTSTLLQYAAILAPAVLALTPVSEWGTICVMYGESLLLSYGLKETCKALVFRKRPYLYFDTYREALEGDGDWNCSFPSGHSLLAFNGAAFASSVFSLFFPDSPWKRPVSIASYALAATTAALRVASGKHFLSDVLGGAAIGTLTGILTPYLHTLVAKRRKEETGRNLSLSLIPGGLYCSVSF